MLRHLFDRKCTLHEVDCDEIAMKTEGFVAQDFVDFINRAVFESLKEGKHFGCGEWGKLEDVSLLPFSFLKYMNC